MERPNILLVTSHDTGRHLGCYGVETVHTPNLDRFAAEGIRFTRAFATSPSCSPSRSSIATGRHPHANGVLGLCGGPSGWDLHDDERPIASLLAERGYFCFGGGILHESLRPRERLGFHEVRPGLASMRRGGAEGAAQWLREEAPRDTPFYAQIGFFETHRNRQLGFGYGPDTEHGVHIPPYLLPGPEAREDFAYFQGCIRAFDEGIGQVLAALDEAGLRERTVVILTTDHGIPFPRAKCTVQEAGLETYLMIRDPEAALPAGSTVDALVSLMDLFPTILERAGAETPSALRARLHGRSFAPLLRGEPYEPRDAVFGGLTEHEYLDPRRCIRTETRKLIVNFARAPVLMDASQQWRPKTTTRVPEDPGNGTHPAVELYDLEADPLEEHNLVDDPAWAGERDGLLARLDGWMRETEDPLVAGIPEPPAYRRAWEAIERARGA